MPPLAATSRTCLARSTERKDAPRENAPRCGGSLRSPVPGTVPSRASARCGIAIAAIHAALVLATIAGLATACSRERPAPEPRPSTSAGEATAGSSDETDPEIEERLERLRSLGYLDDTGLPKAAPGRGVQVFDAANAYPGYTLVVFAGACTAQLLAPNGKIAREWKAQAPCHRWEHAELLPDSGDVVVVGSELDEEAVPNPIECGRYLTRLAWDGKVVWHRRVNAHHDVALAPDGSLLTLVLKRRRIPAIDPERDVADDRLTRIALDGKELESFSLYDVLAGASVPFPIQRAGEGGTAKHGVIDLLHSNAIRPAAVPALAARNAIYGSDSVVVTSRHQDAIFVIDWKSRRLLWHWGRGVVSGPHEATALPNGNFLVFDNGLSRGWSRVLEVSPDSPATPTQFAPGKPFFSRVMGSCQRLPNGNTLVVHSEGGAAFELSPRGGLVWSYEGTLQTPDGHRVKIIRMRKIPSAVIDAILARREAKAVSKRS